MTTIRSAWLFLLLSCLGAAHVPAAQGAEHAGHDGDDRATTTGFDDGLRSDFFLLAGGSLRATNGLSDPNQTEPDAQYVADFMLDVSYRQVRLFGEYVITDHETELERFQVGWEPKENLLIWLGRYHQPSSYWNQRYHHGQYLQTPITRPRVEEWEDTRGVLPQHMVGALVETTWRTRGPGTVDVTVGAGLSPVLADGELDTYSLLHSNESSVRGAYNLRLDFRPDPESENSLGLLLSHNEIGVKEGAVPTGYPAFDHIDQNIIGAYVDWSYKGWRALGTAYFVRADLAVGKGYVEDHFAAAYLEIERQLLPTVAVVARQEIFTEADSSLYLRLFPDRIKYKTMGGLRWDFARKQALKLEIATVATPADHFDEIRIEWSGAIP